MKLTDEQRNKELAWVSQKRKEMREQNREATLRLVATRRSVDRSFYVEMAIIIIGLILGIIGLFLIP